MLRAAASPYLHRERERNMRRYYWVILTLAALASSLALFAGIGAARQISLGSQFIRDLWPNAERLAIVTAGLPGVECIVTLEGSFHSRTIAKVRGALIGYLTNARVQHPCNGGEAWFLNGVERVGNTLPWHIKYESFRGVLPNIRDIRIQIIGLAILTEELFNRCLWQSTSARPAFAEIAITGGSAIGLFAEPSEIPRQATLGLSECVQTSWENGSFMKILNTSTNVAVTLI
ncbi:MAG TPA: hypothetical protein VF250_15850 [Conexibacter sp.]